MNSILFLLLALLSVAYGETFENSPDPEISKLTNERIFFYVPLIQHLRDGEIEGVQTICAPTLQLCSNEKFDLLQTANELKELKDKAGDANIFAILNQSGGHADRKTSKLLKTFGLSNEQRDKAAFDLQHDVGAILQMLEELKEDDLPMACGRARSGQDRHVSSLAKRALSENDYPAPDVDTVPATQFGRCKTPANVSKALFFGLIGALSSGISATLIIAAFFLALATIPVFFLGTPLFVGLPVILTDFIGGTIMDRCHSFINSGYDLLKRCKKRAFDPRPTFKRFSKPAVFFFDKSRDYFGAMAKSVKEVVADASPKSRRTSAVE